MTKHLKQNIDALLVINAGSSSIKFALYQEQNLQLLCRGQVSSFHQSSTTQFEVMLEGQALKTHSVHGVDNHQQAIDVILTWIDDSNLGWHLCAAGHRVVHGGAKRDAPVMINSQIIDELLSLAPLAPLHQAHNLAAINSIIKTHPKLPQVACFDTAFHSKQDAVQRLLPLPKKFRDKGLMRYGFHGLSYDFLVNELRIKLEGELPDNVVMAHLGNGASICALKKGKSVASSMSFSTLDGLLMGSRCGAIDAGVLLYLLQTEGLSADELSTCLYEESGLLGLSGLSSDVRDLEKNDCPDAQLALEYYVDSIVKHIVTAAATLEGMNALVFSGGVGENSVWVRQQVLNKLKWLGVEMNESANLKCQQLISTDQSEIQVYVLKTDEAHIIARHTKLTCHLD